MNRVELIGSLLEVPSYTETGETVTAARFTLIVLDVAWNPEARKYEIVRDFIGCRLFGPAAAVLFGEAPLKGEQLYILGKLDQRQEPDESGSLDKAKTRVRVAFYERLAPRPLPPI